MSMVTKIIVYELYKDMLLLFGPHGNMEKRTSKFMFLMFCKTRSRETRGESILELCSTIPTYHNPINMNPGPLLSKVSVL